MHCLEGPDSVSPDGWSRIVPWDPRTGQWAWVHRHQTVWMIVGEVVVAVDDDAIRAIGRQGCRGTCLGIGDDSCSWPMTEL